MNKILKLAFVLGCAIAVKPGALQAEPSFSWTGWYIGVESGGATASSQQTNLRTGGTRPAFDQTGGMVGGTLGYNWQQANWIFGIETDFSSSHIGGEEHNCGTSGTDTCGTTIRNFGTARGRLGMTVGPSTMVYATGGLAYGEIHAYKLGTATTGGNDWRATWTAGGGVETYFAPHWSLKVEYLYASFSGNATIYTIPGAPANPVAATEKDMQILRAGVNVHF